MNPVSFPSLDAARSLGRGTGPADIDAGELTRRGFETVTSRASSRPRRSRRGVTTVELALTLPILFFMFFSAFEFSRANMIRHTVQTAAYEGARRGVVPGATAKDVQAAASVILNAASAKSATITVEPDTITDETPQITVTVTVPLDDNGWVVPKFFKGRTLSGSMTLSRERTDLLKF